MFLQREDIYSNKLDCSIFENNKLEGYKKFNELEIMRAKIDLSTLNQRIKQV